jgi:histidyl-tRNA synthetase
MEKITSLNGFRDFYPDLCAVRNYVFHNWRETARTCAFTEYEIPVLERTELYRRKSGDEIVRQLFHFTDGGGREVALRPETTPSLARIAAARQRDFRKPMKWFQIGACFRYERPQDGRGREFYQWNCDILGENSPAADADLIATAILVMRRFGFTKDDFRIRLSDRNVWSAFLASQNVHADHSATFLQIIDKLEREEDVITAERLAAIGTSLDAVRTFIAAKGADHPPLKAILADLAARGLDSFVEIDLGIVRGLAYYTGVVFEIFDLNHGMRAVAGGGRYDNLCKLIGGTDLPAAGFAMGDMVITNLIRKTPRANALMESWLASQRQLYAFIVIAEESRRPDALNLVQSLRAAGFSCDYSYQPAKVGKQFQIAEQLGARYAITVGSEFPTVKLKLFASRTESSLDATTLVDSLKSALASTP